ncbi:hypothetical protein Pelo_13060 [Pelomyxa schiedti]|nr:hypothetical protein Pelo_13060 [Pelomyxa schiedti]
MDRRRVIGVAVGAVGVAVASAVAYKLYSHWFANPPVKRVKLGVIGVTKEFPEAAEAATKIREFLQAPGAGVEVQEVVSGLVAVGVPLIAYKEAQALGITTVGIAPPLANYVECFPCDRAIIVGEEWGDETKPFLEYIDMLVLVGQPSPQNDREYESFPGPKCKIALTPKSD